MSQFSDCLLSYLKTLIYSVKELTEYDRKAGDNTDRNALVDRDIALLEFIGRSEY